MVSHRDGRLQERDQVLVINGYPLEAGISHQQALALLQQPGDTVELVVARECPLNASSPSATVTNTVRIESIIRNSQFSLTSSNRSKSLQNPLCARLKLSERSPSCSQDQFVSHLCLLERVTESHIWSRK